MYSLVFALLFLANDVSCLAEDSAALPKLADDFWNWRAKYAPFTGDDVNRIKRPGPATAGRDWSRTAIDSHRKELAEFEARWKKIDASDWPIPTQVDYRLIGSALARVRWELDINPRLETRSDFLHRADTDADCRSADCAGAVR
jgi:hypothetical protein